MNTKKLLSSEEIHRKLIAAGVQPTLQRLSICRYVLCEADHPTAEQVKEWADKHLEKISQATVYNTLNTLVDAGILREFKFPHSDKVVYDCNTHDHFHFLDEASGKLYDIDTEDVAIDMKAPGDFKIRSMEIVFKGELKSSKP